MAPFSKKRLMHHPMNLQSHYEVGVLVFIEYHRRFFGPSFGLLPTPLKEDAFSSGGYCLDAHDLLPAGSTEFQSFGHEPDEWLASPTTLVREEPRNG